MIAIVFGSDSQCAADLIPRIDLMPDFPQPYLMRDWKRVAQGYDSLVFDQDLTGQYLPLVFFRNSSQLSRPFQLWFAYGRGDLKPSFRGRY